MDISFTRAWVRQVALGIVTVVLAGCAAMSMSPEEVIKGRSNEYWKARATQDYEKAFRFLPPSFRAVTTLEAYKKGFQGSALVVSAQAEAVKCETADKCVVTQKLEAKAVLRRASSPPIVTYYDEIWVREDGQWWLFPTE
jgi:hypothetical protein